MCGFNPWSLLVHHTTPRVRAAETLTCPQRCGARPVRTDPGNRTVGFEVCFHQLLQVLFSLLCGCYSMPDPGNHRCSFLLLCQAFFKLSSSLFSASTVDPSWDLYAGLGASRNPVIIERSQSARSMSVI